MAGPAPSDERVTFRRALLPPYQRVPKPRRRTELGLLLMVWVIIGLLYSLTFLGDKGHLPPHVESFLVVLLLLTIGVHLANRWLVPQANPMLLPLATLLNGIGYVEIVRWNPPAAQQQATWTMLGALLYVLTLLVVRRTRDLDRYRYLILALAVVLLLSPLFPVVGTSINGARLWVHFGNSVQFQPVEIAKILLVIFFASYFAEHKELLSIPSTRIRNRLVLNPKPLVPILVMWAFAMVILGAENDIGFAMLLFTLFIVMLWVATGRLSYIVFGLILFALGTYMAAHLFTQFHERISIWLDPWTQATGNGNQLVQSWYSLGTGGVGGTGLGQGQAGLYIPFLTSDLIFTAVGEEMGFMGSSVLIIIFALMVGAGLNIAQRARTDFARLCATGLTVILGFQAFFIMAGVLRILPFTGITLPFVARGGSSLVANYVLIAILLRISDETGPDWMAEEPKTRSKNAQARRTRVLNARREAPR
jgi:cell division protein FtsW (lipid II flippase)